MRRSNRIAGQRRTSLVLSGLVVAISLALPASSAHADQAWCGQVIRGSFSLSNSLLACGGDGLVVGAGGVTIDLNGHTIEGTGLGSGIRVDGHDDVTIRNGTIRNFDHGVLLQPGTQRNTVTGISLETTELAGVQLNDADGNQIRGNRGTGLSGIGVHMVGGASLNFVGHNTFGAGNGEAMVMEGGSNSNRLEGNTVTESSDTSVRIDFSAGNFVIGNTLGGGSDAAIMTTASNGSVIQSNRVLGVGDAAISIAASTRNVVRFNSLGMSADAGVALAEVTDSLVKANQMSHTGDAAIALRLGSSNIRVIDNQADHSSDAGVFLADGVGNVVRGNILLANTTGVEVSGGQQNVVEFNTANASLGSGIELSGSPNSTVFANTVHNNGTGGIVAQENLSSRIEGNHAHANGGDGIDVGGLGTAVVYNLATNNGGWGIYAKDGVIDGGRNGARLNAEAAQCYLILCNDGSGWVAPVRPPEPLDPLEIGLEGGTAPAPLRTLRRPRKAKAAKRLVVVRCKQRRAKRSRRGGRARARKGAVCKASFRARRGSRRLVGRLIRDDHSYAGGRRKVRPGQRGKLAMKARRRPRGGRYTLVLSFEDQRGRPTVVRRPVRVR
jgi:parallel beta-helix repeat protein